MAAGKFIVELEREDDGRWIAEVVALPGVLAYGATREEALAKAEVLALRVRPTASSTAMPSLRSPASSTLRERLASHAGPSGSGRCAPSRVCRLVDDTVG